MAAMKPSRDPCIECRRPMTWAQQRVQFGRLKRLGISAAHIKATLPRCQKCLTIWLRNHPHLVGEAQR